MCTCHPPQTQDIHEKLRKEAPALAQTNGGCLPHKVLSTMADNCPTAKATARHFEKVVRASRESYFSDQQIAALPEEMKHVIAGNCDNHSRSSIATEFFRLSGSALEDVLGEAAEQFSAVERLELSVPSLIYAGCKAVRWTGSDLYALGMQLEFVAYVRDKHPQLAGAHSLVP